MSARIPTGVKILAAFLATKVLWDIVTIAQTWPDFSRPKLGVAVVVPVILWFLLKGRNWALNLAGVVCLFWITFVFARLIGPMFAIEEVKVPFPWSNLLAFPAIFYVLSNLRTDAEVESSSSADQTKS